MANKECFALREAGAAPQIIDIVNSLTGVGMFSGETLEQVCQRHPGVEKEALDVIVMEQEDAYRTHPQPISQDAWMQALEVLPPENWIRQGNTESFKFVERYSGRITSIFARIGSDCFTFKDVYTLSHAEIMDRIAKCCEVQTGGEA